MDSFLFTPCSSTYYCRWAVSSRSLPPNQGTTLVPLDPWFRLSVILTLGVAITLGSAWLAKENFRNYRRYRNMAPLEHLTGDAALFVKDPWGLPSRWPDPRAELLGPELSTSTRCLSYARLAENRAADLEMLAEILIVMSGALLGLSVAVLFGSQYDAGDAMWVGFRTGLAAVPALLGGFIRQFFAPRWRAWAVLYRTAAQRVSELQQENVPSDSRQGRRKALAASGMVAVLAYLGGISHGRGHRK